MKCFMTFPLDIYVFNRNISEHKQQKQMLEEKWAAIFISFLLESKNETAYSAPIAVLVVV